jgi:hypothetical protein
LLSIGMKFVQVKEATSSYVVAGTSWNTLPNSSADLPSGAKVRACVGDLNGSFSYRQTNFFQLVQADVD